MYRVFLVLSTLLCAASSVAHQSATGIDLPVAVLREVKEVGRLPRGNYELVKRWSAIAGAQHMTGRAVADAEASGKRAWEALCGSAVPGRPPIYGPYLTVTEGDYVALMRIRLLDDVGEEHVADLDAAVGYGQTICAVRELTGSDLEMGRYVRVPIAFHCPGGKLEVRLHWTGYASLRVDTIELYRLNGGSVPASGVPRAPEAVPSGRPTDLDVPAVKRPYPEVFPLASKPASTLLVCDITKQRPDVQLCVLVMQGIVNRKQPVLYCLFNETDATWLNWMRRSGHIKATRTIAPWTSLIGMFKGHLKGVIITDPALPASKNVANMLASIEDCLVVSPRLHKVLQPALMRVGLPVKADLRRRWKTSADAYRWALDNLWPKLNHHLAACSYPDHLGLRDYLTQNRAFIFWISGPIDGARPYADPTAEAKVAEDLLSRMPPNCPIMSYPWAAKDVGIGEGPGVTLFAEFAKYLVGSINCTNLSVHSGLAGIPLRPRMVPPPRLDTSKVYVSFIMSDGDNLPVLTVSNFPQLWASNERGKVPMGWTVSPSASLLIPDILNYYYSTATPNDAFLGAVSGVGYTYPDSYGLRYKPELRSDVFDGFLSQTERYMKRAGLRSLWIMNATQPEKIRRYAERIGTLEALFPDYGRRVSDYSEATYPSVRNVPVFHAVTGWTENATKEQRIAQMVAEIRSITPSDRPAFLHVFIWNWGADMSIYPEVMKRLGPAYVAVRPDHLAALYRQNMQKRQLLVRIPEHMLALEGRPVQLNVTLHNVGGAAMDARMRVSGSADDGQATPSSVTLQPGEPVDVAIAGTPAGDELGLLIQTSAGERRYSVPVRRIAASEFDATALPQGTLQFVRRYEGETLAHNSGAVATDAGASNSAIWRADATTAKPGEVVFGPYAPLAAGKCIAIFRLKGGGSGVIGKVDTCVGGGAPITASREIRAEDVAEDQFRCILLEFTHPGGAVETRVGWYGQGWIGVDWVALFRIEP